jgi:cellulose synthase (UDP-forming)
VQIDGAQASLVDISVGGAAVRLREGSHPSLGVVDFTLPGAAPIKMIMARLPSHESGYELASLQTIGGDWSAYKTMSLWLFHTPAGALPELPPNVPAIALTTR